MTSDPQATQETLLAEIQKVVTFIESVYRTVLNRPPTMPEVEKYTNAIYEGLLPADFFYIVNNSEERRSQAKLFVVPGSYQSPIANPAELHDYVRAVSSAGPELAGIAIDRDAMVATWQRLLPFLTTCPLPAQQTPGFYYYSENLFYDFADGCIFQAMLRLHAPKRLIEIGSGFSSACAIDTIDRFLNGACEVTFIEPQPERLLGLLGERARGTRFINAPVQAVPPAVFEKLQAGDFLFIDSSHVLRTGSDVCFELFEILPRLAPDVIVHIHDIHWPFEYPANWILQQNRSYNEAYAVRAFLIDNPHWNIVYFSDYFARFERARVEETFPNTNGKFGGSLWLQRR